MGNITEIRKGCDRLQIPEIIRLKDYMGLMFVLNARESFVGYHDKDRGFVEPKLKELGQHYLLPTENGIMLMPKPEHIISLRDVLYYNIRNTNGIRDQINGNSVDDVLVSTDEHLKKRVDYIFSDYEVDKAGEICVGSTSIILDPFPSSRIFQIEK